MVAQAISFLLRSGAGVFVAVGGYWQQLPDFAAARRLLRTARSCLLFGW